jgi:hypothetical protein
MANVKIIFESYDSSDFHNTELQCFATTSNDVYIEIKDVSCEHDYNVQYIRLDRETAIKLHRELKKQISFLEVEQYKCNL